MCPCFYVRQSHRPSCCYKCSDSYMLDGSMCALVCALCIAVHVNSMKHLCFCISDKGQRGPIQLGRRKKSRAAKGCKGLGVLSVKGCLDPRVT